jgi:hypothetical protein
MSVHSSLRLEAAPFYYQAAQGERGKREPVQAFSLAKMLEMEPARLLPHEHASFQLLVTSGSALIEINGRESGVTNTSIVLVRPFSLHRIAPCGPLSGTSISFSPSCLEKLFGGTDIRFDRREEAAFPAYQLSSAAGNTIKETTALLQAEFDGSLTNREIVVMGCLRILLIRMHRLMKDGP